MDKARSLHKGWNILGDFGGEVVRYMAYLLNIYQQNHFPTSPRLKLGLAKTISHEHLYVFSCVVFAKFVGGHLKTFIGRSKNMVYFGVEDGTRSNCLFDPQDQKL